MAIPFRAISSQEGRVPSRLRPMLAVLRSGTEASFLSSHPAREASAVACNPMLAPIMLSAVPKRVTIRTTLCRGQRLRLFVRGICSFGRSPIAVRQLGCATLAIMRVVMRRHTAKSPPTAHRLRVRLPLCRPTYRLAVVLAATSIGLVILKTAGPFRAASRGGESAP